VIEKIIEFSARNKFFVLVLTAVAMAIAVWTLNRQPLDAVPDLSDTQVIIYSKWDRSPDIVEDQVTYPIVSALLGTPHVKTVRGISDFGYSYVYVIFEDGTDLYWARSRVLEYLSKVTPNLPDGVQTSLGPDATSVGWVYQYALIDESQKLNLAELRSLQDWQLKFHLQSIPGVAEVASIGGYVKQYQINVDPNKLTAYKVSLLELVKAVKQSNSETGGRVLEFAGTEYMVRGRGYLKSLSDIEKTVVKTDPQSGVPILVQHLGRVELGPEMRRGVTDLNGWGDAPGGIIVMRQGENALNVINAVKRKLDELAPTLPEGVKIIPVYDRSDLIERAIDSLQHKLTLEIIIVSLVILLFLWHIPSAIVPILTIPISILLAFIPLYFFGVTTNIMSLSGIAISIGVLVDGAIVEVENAYKKLEHWIAEGRKGDFHDVRLNALKEVGPSVFFSLLVITVSFLPVFTLVDQEGRLFKPLAISKTMTMAMAALLALTLDPALRMMFSRMEPFHFKPRWLARASTQLAVGNYYPEEKHPISRILFKLYEPVVHFVLKHRKSTLAMAGILMLLTIPAYLKLGREFMPPLNEGSYLYMPTTLPGMAVSEAKRLLQKQNEIIKSFPEVATVYGKAGRAETSTDAAPFSMVETIVVLKPTEEWPKVEPDNRRRSFDELRQAMDEKLKFAGFPNIWTMPIKNRIDMLSTGIRTPVGIKVLGPDVHVIQKISEEIEAKIRPIAGTRTVYAERTSGGYYVDIVFNRDELARYGIPMEEAQMIVASAIGGENVSYTVEGLERYPINVRYAREFREDLESLKRVLVPTPQGLPIPLAQLAEIRRVEGPAMIRNENGMRAGYVYIDIENRDVGGYVNDAKQVMANEVKLPKGYSLNWSGQFENMIRVKERLTLIVPLTIFLIAMLLYMSTRSWIKTGIVMLAVPFSLIGAVWLLYILDYNISIAVWVGMIALMGLDAETGVFMLLYLDLAYEDRVKAGRMRTATDLREAIMHGAVKRIRPKMMTVMAAFMGLIPIMWSMGTGSDVMKRIAAPMVGGLITSFALELVIYPVLYFIWKSKSVMKEVQA
jgi:Cu(I)/Ag(I) efflux system membrane protein CusA/SilA